MDQRTSLPTLAVGGAVLVGIGVWLGRRSSSSGGDDSKLKREAGTGWHDRELRPPFPKEIVALLSSASLCYLSTTLDDSPHLSLMTFTYHQPSQQIIFTTRRNTRKCRHLESNPRVAILIHDFPALHDGASEEFSQSYASATYSITMYGEASVLADGPEAEKLRKIHLDRSSPEAQVFIRGEGIAVVTIDVECARVCDSQDQVKTWNVSGGWGGDAPSN